MAPPVTPELLLHAYRAGLFPMSDARDDPELYWVEPRRRAVLPLDHLHVSRSLARRIRRGGFSVSYDSAFRAVMEACAGRAETWINAPILDLYTQLHEAGRAHSVEVWQDGALAGGLYGLEIGAAFFAESMVSPRTDGSKLALTWLVDRLRSGGFQLLDAQFLTPHLASLGFVEIDQSDYRILLAEATERSARFGTGPAATGQEVLQRRGQTS
ncbi:leucyl/phenylalanyl-tRNA--protein transferase [Pseudoroseicyclus aestuarii]|uniref:Leucyl/phenylalanyl-tRNA--protein transferase n=1 Tax=Pseudoroseicyclus aestuarii TaxID=1795041 RepID=A0A318T004_9RHOB|nr:leucyl/phenylalanyl-tRNA--protein transferase [Pseudoroseicyclus aestuarii]PYE86026.1 leucyl/phenylalanyl-tRNA--protein transferase [Pseudoroseicyclus aestuarii]